MQNESSLLRRIVIGAVALVALFAVGGAALFFARPSAAQSIVDSIPYANRMMQFGGPMSHGIGMAGGHHMDTAQMQAMMGGDFAMGPEMMYGFESGMPGGGWMHGGGHGWMQGGHGDMHETMTTALANLLGLSVEEIEAQLADGATVMGLAAAAEIDLDKLADAMHAAHVQAVAAALSAGEISQEQADAIFARMAMHETMRGVIDRDAIHAAVAGALGLTVEEFDAALASGTPMPEIAAEQGVDLDDVQAAAEAAREQMIADAVAAGVITQAQADELADMHGQCGGSGMGHGRGMGPGMGRGRSPQRGFPGFGPFSPETAPTTGDA